MIKYGGEPILVVKDDETGYITANVVPREGAEPFAVKSLNRDVVKLMGHTKIILKSDLEPAIIDLEKTSSKVQDWSKWQ